MAIELSKPVMPKEHGLWAWVFLPLVVGAACAKGTFANAYPLFVTGFFGFLALTPARIFYKNARRNAAQEPNVLFWLAIFSALAVAAGGYLSYLHPRLIPIVALMAAGFYLGVRASHGGFQRSVWFEFGGLSALSLGSLLGAYTVAGTLTRADGGVWVFVLLFMLDRSIESRRIVRLGGFLPVLAKQEVRMRERLKPILAGNLFLSFLTPLFAMALAEKLGLPLSLAVPFIPGFFMTLLFFLRHPSSLRQVGFSELLLAIGYGVAFPFLFNLQMG